MTTQSIATFLKNVFDASRKSGNATQELVAIIRARNINWDATETVKPMRREFYLGRIATSLDMDRVKAIIVLDKVKFKQSDNSDKRRTEDEQKSYRAAVSAWSHVAMLAGQPNKKTGATRKPKVTKANQDKSGGNAATDLISGAVTVAPATKPDDVRAFALRMADLVDGYIKQNNKLITGALGDALRHFPEDTRKLAKA